MFDRDPLLPIIARARLRHVPQEIGLHDPYHAGKLDYRRGAQAPKKEYTGPNAWMLWWRGWLDEKRSRER